MISRRRFSDKGPGSCVINSQSLSWRLYTNTTEREIRQICIEQLHCVGYWLDDSYRYRVYCDQSSVSFCNQAGVSVDNLEHIFGSDTSNDQISTSRSCMVRNNVQEHDKPTAILQIDSGTFSDTEGRLNEDSIIKNISVPPGFIMMDISVQDLGDSRVRIVLLSSVTLSSSMSALHHSCIEGTSMCDCSSIRAVGMSYYDLEYVNDTAIAMTADVLFAEEKQRMELVLEQGAVRDFLGNTNERQTFVINPETPDNANCLSMTVAFCGDNVTASRNDVMRVMFASSELITSFDENNITVNGSNSIVVTSFRKRSDYAYVANITKVGGAAGMVLVRSIDHPTVGDNGQYFYFDTEEWEEVFGDFTSGEKRLIYQYRDGNLVASYTVIVWDNHNGMHGRCDSGSAAGQWEVGDRISPRERSPQDESGTVSVTSSSIVMSNYLRFTSFDASNWEFMYGLDLMPLTITITSPNFMSGSTSNDATLNLTFTTSESTSDFTVADIIVEGGTLTSFTGSGTFYYATFVPLGPDGMKNISVASAAFTDCAGNINVESNTLDWTYDRTAPTVTISSSDVSDGSSSMDTTFQFTFNTSEITTDFAIEDVHVLGGVLKSFTGSGTSYSATFISSAEGGLREVRVDAAVFTDSAGNTNLPSNDFNFTYVASDITSAYGWVQRGSTIYGTNDGCTFFHLK